MITIDEKNSLVIVEDGSGEARYAMDTPEAFEIVSKAWLRCGWDTKHVYTFSWLGRPIIQLPEDLLRLQEVIYTVKPDVIIETGVAHGGGLVFYATLCQALNRGRVIGVDIEIRPHNRSAIEAHPLAPLITLIEGSSTAPEILDQIERMIRPGEAVLVILDSNHTREHVLAELNFYSGLVTKGSYIVATDGIMKDLAGAPRSSADWGENNPCAAVEDFLVSHPAFAQVEPPWLFNESNGLSRRVTYWPSAYLRLS